MGIRAMAGRPERVRDLDAGPVAQFGADLNELRHEARLTYRQLAPRAFLSPATLNRAASGERLPALETTQAFVRGCEGDVERWTARWHATNAALTKLEVPPSVPVRPPIMSKSSALTAATAAVAAAEIDVLSPQEVTNARMFAAQLRRLAVQSAENGGTLTFSAERSSVLVRILLLEATPTQLVKPLGMSLDTIRSIASTAPTEQQWDDGRNAVVDLAYEAGEQFSVAFEWGEVYKRLRAWQPNPEAVHTLADLRQTMSAAKDRAFLSYTQLARASGNAFSRSTAHVILTGSSAPRPAQVETFLVACGIAVDDTWRSAIERALTPATADELLASDADLSDSVGLLAADPTTADPISAAPTEGEEVIATEPVVVAEHVGPPIDAEIRLPKRSRRFLSLLRMLDASEAAS
jgi:hypothetical protein